MQTSRRNVTTHTSRQPAMGSTTTPKLRACDRCAAIKQVCDREEKEGDSCSRCTRLELSCVIARIHKPMGRPRKKPQLTILPSQKPEILPGGVPKILILRTQRPPAKTKRTRSGCLTCKQRRKKCDEALPICGDCSRLGLPCQRSPPAPPPPCRRTSTTPHFTFPIYAGSTPQEQHLLQHYTHVVSRSLSVVPDSINDFISLFVPMALQQPAMRSALLGLAATHLKRIHSSFSVPAVEYQNRALHQANQLLKLGTDEAVMEGLAAVLFLCLQEVCEGKSRKWPLHLEAAVAIINNRGGPSAFPEEVNGSILRRHRDPQLLQICIFRPTILPPPVSSSSTALPAHALFGTSHALFAIIADISQLAQMAHIRHTSPLAEQTFHHMASELELQLQEWTPSPCKPVESDPGLEGKVTAAGVMLQWAALMRLHLVVSDGGMSDLSHPLVRVAVNNILTALETIPQGDLVESMLIFPVFAAGFAAVGEEREKVDKRFAVMEKSIGFGNVFDAREAVKAHWGRMERGEYRKWEGAICGAVGEQEGEGVLIMTLSVKSNGLTELGEECSQMDIRKALRVALDRTELEQQQQDSTLVLEPVPTPQRYVALGFAESDLQSPPKANTV
ncbi:fungal-specific transcription factor domain-containing protein [Trichophaea hybrida]|nr:fungal-specific transcription factor domain-containing protein [Trichophaea hybrida]